MEELLGNKANFLDSPVLIGTVTVTKSLREQCNLLMRNKGESIIFLRD